MTSMISSNKYPKKRKMKTQSKEGIKPTIIGSTLPKTGEDELYSSRRTAFKNFGKVDTNYQEQCDGFSTKVEVMMYESFVPKK